MKNYLSLAFAIIATITFAAWLIYMGMFFLTATYMMVLIIIMEFLPAANTRRRMGIRHIIQCIFAMGCFCLSSTIVREHEDAILIIITFVFTMFSLVFFLKIAFSWRYLIDDLRSGSDR